MSSKYKQRDHRAEQTVDFLRTHKLRLLVFGALFLVLIIALSVFIASKVNAREEASVLFGRAAAVSDYSFIADNFGDTLYGSYALFLKGSKLYQEGSYDQAIETFTRFVKKHPGHLLFGRAKAALGYCYERKNDTQSALEWFQKANEVEKNPAWNEDNLLSIARLHEAKDAPKALALYEEFLRTHPLSIWDQTVAYKISLLRRSLAQGS